MDILTGLIWIVLIFLVAYFLGIFRGAPFVPTKQEALDRMIESAQIKSGDKLADLGSGDGRVLIAAAKAGALAHGYEINPLLVLISKYKIKKAGLDTRAFVHWKNFWLVNFSEFQIVTLFGVTGIMQGLEKKLQAELKPGGRVISNIFRFPSWLGEKNSNIFIYKR